MAGITYVNLIISILIIGIGIAIILRIYNIVAGIEILGFKLPKI